MKLGDVISVSGCVTKDKFIAGRSLAEIEKILGFKNGRFTQGIAIVALLQLPEMNEFELAAYSNVATHRHATPAGLNIEKLKAEAKSTWKLTGLERLAKVLPMIRHDSGVNPDIQYPPGQGAPQWLVRVQLRARVSGLVSDYPNGRYIAT